MFMSGSQIPTPFRVRVNRSRNTHKGTKPSRHNSHKGTRIVVITERVIGRTPHISSTEKKMAPTVMQSKPARNLLLSFHSLSSVMQNCLFNYTTHESPRATEEKGLKNQPMQLGFPYAQACDGITRSPEDSDPTTASAIFRHRTGQESGERAARDGRRPAGERQLKLEGNPECIWMAPLSSYA